jgi:hypothetical protein
MLGKGGHRLVLLVRSAKPIEQFHYENYFGL